MERMPPDTRGAMAAESLTSPSQVMANNWPRTSHKTVKIWDPNTGVCLQTINLVSTVESIAFDASGLFLHSEIGTVSLDIGFSFKYHAWDNYTAEVLLQRL